MLRNLGKKGIYRINDNMLQFYYRFIAPHRSILELRRIDTVMHLINAQFTQHVGDCWEHLCRQYISGNEIDGIVYNIASRWWGKIFPEGNKEGTMIELDVVAESFDKKHILIGECKWTNKEDAQRLARTLSEKAAHLPFIKDGQEVHLVLFLKQEPEHQESIRYFLPEDIIETI